MKTAVCFIVSILSISVHAHQYAIPLPGLHGNYTFGTSKTVSFDAGVSFSSINQVNIVLEGRNYPALCGGVECPLHSCYGYLKAEMYPDPNRLGCPWYAYGAKNVFQSYYNDNAVFAYLNVPWCPAASWDFLLDGTGQITLSFSYGVGFCTIMQQGYATVTQAVLVIDAQAPGLRMINPTQHQMVLAGSLCQIQWEDMDSPNCQGDYQLEFSIDNGQNWLPLTSVSQTCSYDWTVPDIAVSACHIKLIKNDGSGLQVARGPFSIYQCQSDIPGDFVKDCYVNLKDLQALVSNWLCESDCAIAIAGDMDGNCRVELADFALFAKQWMLCINSFDPACSQNP